MRTDSPSVWFAWSAAACCILLTSTICPADEVSFDERLDKITRTNIEIVGVAGRRSQYERLMADFPDHPRIAEVMVKTAFLHQDGEQLMWLRKSIEAATRGSDTWFRACEYVLGRIPFDSDEAIELLKRMASQAVNNPLQLYKLEYRYVGNARQRRDVVSALRHTRRMMRWHPETGVRRDKGEIDYIRRRAWGQLLEMYTEQDWPTDFRRKLIDAFESEFAIINNVHFDCEEARKRLSARMTNSMPTGLEGLCVQAHSWLQLVLLVCSVSEHRPWASPLHVKRHSTQPEG